MSERRARTLMLGGLMLGGAALASFVLLGGNFGLRPGGPEAPAAPVEPSTRRVALTPQGCVTECQTRQTDCILACEGAVPCEQRCVAEGKACAHRCVTGARRDAGAGVTAPRQR